MKKIALEEHFMAPGLEEYWAPDSSNHQTRGAICFDNAQRLLGFRNR